jgi:hypothetical protein
MDSIDANAKRGAIRLYGNAFGRRAGRRFATGVFTWPVSIATEPRTPRGVRLRLARRVWFGGAIASLGPCSNRRRHAQTLRGRRLLCALGEALLRPTMRRVTDISLRREPSRPGYARHGQPPLAAKRRVQPPLCTTDPSFSTETNAHARIEILFATIVGVAKTASRGVETTVAPADSRSRSEHADCSILFTAPSEASRGPARGRGARERSPQGERSRSEPRGPQEAPNKRSAA